MNRSRLVARVVTMAMVMGTLFGSPLQAAHASRGKSAGPAVVRKTPNLIKNPGAQSGTGSTDGSIVTVPNWSTYSDATVVQYGSPGGFPDANTPGPPQRGTNFFDGGLNTLGLYPLQTELQQTVRLGRFRAAIDAGRVSFTAKAWLGGYAADKDNARVYFEFDDAQMMDVGEASLSPVTRLQRQSQTKFLLRTSTGMVPKTARTVFISIVFIGLNGVSIDGYADNLSLVLSGI
jgi:hypothetical protein